MQAEDKKYLGIKFVHLLLLSRPETSERAAFIGSLFMQFVHIYYTYISFYFKVSDCDIDEMFTYADADCDGRIRYRSV